MHYRTELWGRTPKFVRTLGLKVFNVIVWLETSSRQLIIIIIIVVIIIIIITIIVVVIIIIITTIIITIKDALFRKRSCHLHCDTMISLDFRQRRHQPTNIFFQSRNKILFQDNINLI